MSVLTYRDFCRKLKNGEKLGGVWAFVGEEDYTKYDAVAKLKKAASESGFGEFNFISLTASEYSVSALSDAVMTPPLMSDLKLVQIIGADVFTASEKKKKETEAELVPLLSGVSDDTAVAFLYSSEELTQKDISQSSLTKSLAKAGTEVNIVNCDKATPAEIEKWIQNRFKALGVTSDADTAQLLAKRCGYSMFSLVGEINKLAAYVGAEQRNEIKPEDVVSVVSESVEIGAFELTNAISDRRISDALTIYAKMKNRADNPRIILASLISDFSALCKMKTAQDAGESYQLAAKTYGINEYRAKLLYNNLRRCDSAYIERTMKLFTHIDKTSKSLDTDLYMQLEQLISSLR